VLLSVRAQQALHNKNLDGSEDFSISGINAVKAYPSGEFAAENAVFQSIEARYRLPDLGRFTVTRAPFFEIGRAMTENKTGSNAAQTLSDTGLNVYTTYGNLFATTTLAQRLSSASTSEKTPERVLLVSGGVRF
jgi:hemolysin activation/secretion protein